MSPFPGLSAFDPIFQWLAPLAELCRRSAAAYIGPDAEPRNESRTHFRVPFSLNWRPSISPTSRPAGGTYFTAVPPAVKINGALCVGWPAAFLHVESQMIGLRISSIVLLLALALPPISARGDDARTVDYVQDVKPIFAKNCTACHGAEKQKSGLRLDSVGLAKRGGDSGPAIEPGKSAESLLVLAITGGEGVAAMPPKGEAP